MYLYITIVFIASIVAATLGLTLGTRFFGATDGEVLLSILLTLIVLLVVDALIATIGHKLPKKWMNPYKKIYRVFSWERKIYLWLKVKKWKDKIPEPGKILTGFGKRKVESFEDSDYLYMFMIESVYGEVIHFWSIIFGFLATFIYPKLFLVVGLPLIIANIILNLLPIIVQRFNRPKLMIAYERAKKKKETN